MPPDKPNEGYDDPGTMREERRTGKDHRDDREKQARDEKSGDRRNDEEDRGDEDSNGGEKKPSFFRNPLFLIGAGIVLFILIVAAVLYWLHARLYEDTDDAFIDTHIVHVSAQVSGQVVRVYVNDNQLVRAGEPLAEIDTADPQAKLNQVIAQEAQAETSYNQAIASQAGAAAQAANANADLARYRLLERTAPSAVARQQLDQAVATARNADAQLQSAAAQVKGAAAQIKSLKAQVAQARINLGYTHIVAPVDGHVTQRTVALGNYVAPGQQLMDIVPLQLWVTANFKETQLDRMRVGQHVKIVIDACPDLDLHGRVNSIQRGAGQAFGILPPENATGNYVKVVQRVPVKIVLNRIPRDCPLGPGMSVEPTVKVR